jgi:PqqD family protein of HPr-rel-A system
VSSADVSHWRSPALKGCRWASWETGEYFLFNPISGKTHLLNELGRTLLQAMADRPCDSVELAGLITEADAEPVASDIALIEDQLRQLHLLGLIERTQ